MAEKYKNGNPRNYQNKQSKKIDQITNEFCSYNSSLTYSSYGLDIFNAYKKEQLEDLANDPMSNNQLLRELSLKLYSTNGIYSNTVDYMTSLLSLYNVVVTYGKNSKAKQRNKQLMESTLRTIKDKEIVRDALFRGMVEGIAFYYFETTSRPCSRKKMMNDYDVESIIEINDIGVNASVISLSADYTRIIGIKNSSYVIAFNLDYFDNAEGETSENKLKKYPKEIRDAYNARHNGKQLDGGNWVVLDNNKTIVHKIRSKREEKYGRPLVLSAIKDILYGDYFTTTKRNILDEINNRIIYQTFPEGKEKGSSALTRKQQENQHNSVKSAVMNKNNRGGISFFSVAAGTKISAIEASNTDIFDSKYESELNDKIAMNMGIASSLLNGSGSGSYSAQQNNLELITSQLIQWVSQIEEELNKCIAKNIIKDDKNRVEVKYLPVSNANKQTMINAYKDLYLQGCGSLSAWIAACGIEPSVYFALLDQEIEDSVYSKYQPHLTSFVMSGKDVADDKGGRPETDNPTENTLISRNNGANDIPSPSDN